MEQGRYVWGFHLQQPYGEWGGHTFDPGSDMGPRPVNAFHINMVHVDDSGIYLSGLRTRALLHIDGGMRVTEVCSLPDGAHNARPYRDGVLFNDTDSDCVRYAGRDGGGVAFKVKTYPEHAVERAGVGRPRANCAATWPTNACGGCTPTSRSRVWRWCSAVGSWPTPPKCHPVRCETPLLDFRLA